MNLKILAATLVAGLSLAACHTTQPNSAAGGTRPTVGVEPAGNTAGLPRNDTTGAHEAQNCTSTVTEADRQHCLSRGTAPTSPSERPVDGGN